MSEWNSAYVETNGIRLHTWQLGSAGPNLVLLHGITDSGRCWARTAEQLAADYRVVALDARGHGLSDKPGSYNSTEHAADVAGAIEALGLAPVVLIGHSMGAEITARVAADYAPLVRAVVLEDPPWRSPEPESEGWSEHLQAWADGLQADQAGTHEALMAQIKERCPGWHESELDAWVTSKFQVSVDVLRFGSGPRTSWRESFQAITCPLLLMTGDPELGALTPPDVAAEFEKLPHVQAVHFDGAGHNIHRDRYEPFIVAVQAFLADILA